MVFKGRRPKRSTVQWFWQIDSNNKRQYNGFGRSQPQTIDSTMVFKGRRQKRLTVQCSWQTRIKNDYPYNGFGRSTPKKNDCAMVLEHRHQRKNDSTMDLDDRNQKRLTLQSKDNNGFGRSVPVNPDRSDIAFPGASGHRRQSFFLREMQLLCSCVL